MKRRTPVFFLLFCLFLQTGVCSAVTGKDDKDRNRLNQAAPPLFAIMSHTAVVLLEGTLPRELWQLQVQSSLAADIALTEGLSAGITVPFSIIAGFPFYGKHSFDGGMEAPYMEFGYNGSSNSISYRVSISVAPITVSGPPFVGVTANIGLIRDPVALKFDVNTEFGPTTVRPMEKWGFRRLGCSTAALIVINHMVSVELALEIQQPLSAMAGTRSPALIGKTGFFLRLAPFTAQLSISRDLWNPGHPVTVSTGITFLWETL